MWPDLVTYLPDGLDPDDVAAATGLVRSYCGWHIAPVITEDIVEDGPGSDSWMLPSMRVLDVTDVVNDGTPVPDPEWSRSGFVRLSRWTGKLRGVSATVTHGYDQCPEEVAAVVRSLAKQGGGPASVLGVKSRQVGPLAWQYTTEQMAGVLGVSVAMVAVLDRYKIAPRP